jgi:hypothetical protein
LRDDALLPALDPPFKWTDRTAAGPDGNYTNWAPQPAGLPYVGYCAMAAAPAPGASPAAAWPWHDQLCNATHAFICRLAANVGCWLSRAGWAVAALQARCQAMCCAHAA